MSSTVLMCMSTLYSWSDDCSQMDVPQMCVCSQQSEMQLDGFELPPAPGETAQASECMSKLMAHNDY